MTLPIEPELLSPPALRSSLPAVHIGSFFDSVSKALSIYIKATPPPEGMSPVFTHDFPKERLQQPDKPFNVITFGVENSQMASSSNDNSRTPLAPQVRSSERNAQMFGYNKTTLAWKELATVRFTCSSRSNKNADILVEWFHCFMMEYAFVQQYFKARGVDYFRFVEREADKIDQFSGQEIYQRFLKYQIRIEYLKVLLDRQLQTLDMTFEAVPDPSLST
jgi:hypothetical protein